MILIQIRILILVVCVPVCGGDIRFLYGEDCTTSDMQTKLVTWQIHPDHCFTLGQSFHLISRTTDIVNNHNAPFFELNAVDVIL